MNNMKKTLPLIIALTALTGCASLTDVNHKWCPPLKQEVVPVPVITPAVEEVALEPAPVAPQVPQLVEISLQADALFSFDKSGRDDLLPEGRKTLDELAYKLSNDFARVDSIHLVGHTDRLGSDSYNQKLGQSRADTVKVYLIQHGVTAPITTSSAGKTQPVTTNCIGNKATPALTACLQPDRRVVVFVSGVSVGDNR